MRLRCKLASSSMYAIGQIQFTQLYCYDFYFTALENFKNVKSVQLVSNWKRIWMANTYTAGVSPKIILESSILNSWSLSFIYSYLTPMTRRHTYVAKVVSCIHCGYNFCNTLYTAPSSDRWRALLTPDAVSGVSIDRRLSPVGDKSAVLTTADRVPLSWNDLGRVIYVFENHKANYWCT